MLGFSVLWPGPRGIIRYSKVAFKGFIEGYPRLMYIGGGLYELDGVCDLGQNLFFCLGGGGEGGGGWSLEGLTTSVGGQVYLYGGVTHS